MHFLKLVVICVCILHIIYLVVEVSSNLFICSLAIMFCPV